jgi:hypothetical protein
MDILLSTHNAVVLSALWYGETAYEAPVNKAGVKISIGAYCTARISEFLKMAGKRIING